MKARNIIEKIWDAHVVAQRDGHPAVFAIDLMLIHEVTSAQAFRALEEHELKPFDLGALVATLDHSIPTRKNRLEIYDEAARTQVETLRKNAAKYGVPIYDFGSGHQGIVHVIGPELGMTQPGMTICCGDSHTSTHGAFGALAFGVGTSEVGHVLASGCLLLGKPRTMKVEFRGEFRPGVFAKDAVLHLISRLGIGGANGHVIEYCGDAVARMSMEERMTVCNMSIECGARAGLIAPDETTLAWLKDRPYAPKDADWERAAAHWMSVRTDPGAHFDREMLIDLSALRPMVTWGTNPGQAIQISEHVPALAALTSDERTGAKRALEYIGLGENAPIAGTPIEWGFIGSCTNGRIGDLRIAARILAGKKVHAGVTLLVVPGSEEVLRQAREEGLDRIFTDAGADFRLPGCSMCLGMNDDKVPPGKRCISSSNRNFVGRQGSGSLTHLASPATVAASAVAGKIISPEAYFA